VIAGADEWGPIVDAIAAGRRVEARLATRGRYVAELPSQNVIAELPGESPATIIVSGHYDTVPGTPGAGDNASGVAGCLALAERFAGERLPKTLRFINWGAHEFGLLGSQFYAQERAQRRELGQIEAAIALDILSDGDRLGVWSGGPDLSVPLGELIPAHAGAFPTELFPRGRGETDSWSFAERGIDTVMLLTLPYAHFHLPTDTVANNDPALFAHAVDIAELIVRHLLERPARSPESSGSSRLVPTTG
jgi:aminopeptidase YwaD